MARTAQFIRSLKPLTAEMIAVLTILNAAPRALQQRQIEQCVAPKGKRVSIAEAVDYLEDKKVGLIEREEKPPKTARFLITAEGERALEHYRDGAIRDLVKRIAKMKQEHPRDGSVLPPEMIDPYEYLLACLQTGRFRKPMFEDDGEDQDMSTADYREAPRSRALETAKRQRDDVAPKRKQPRRVVEEPADEAEDDDGIEEQLAGDEEPAPKPKAKVPPGPRPMPGSRAAQARRRRTIAA